MNSKLKKHKQTSNGKVETDQISEKTYIKIDRIIKTIKYNKQEEENVEKIRQHRCNSINTIRSKLNQKKLNKNKQ